MSHLHDLRVGEFGKTRESRFNGSLSIVLPPKPDAPKESWWIQPTREAFMREQRKQQPRMSGAKDTAKVPIRILDTI